MFGEVTMVWSRFRPEGPWDLSPGFSLGGVIFMR